MGWTKKPCEGCGRQEDYRFRQVGEVCRECKNKLKRYNDIQEYFKDETENKDFVRVGIELYYDAFYVKGVVENKSIPPLIEKLLLLNALPTETIRKEGKDVETIYIGIHSSYNDYRHFALDKPFAECLSKLHDEINLAIGNAYEQGIEKGQDLLGQLNDGVIQQNTEPKKQTQ